RDRGTRRNDVLCRARPGGGAERSSRFLLSAEGWCRARCGPVGGSHRTPLAPRADHAGPSAFSATVAPRVEPHGGACGKAIGNRAGLRGLGKVTRDGKSRNRHDRRNQSVPVPLNGSRTRWGVGPFTSSTTTPLTAPNAAPGGTVTFSL